MSSKYLMLVCEGLTDDPIEELGDKTPLEVAKTPFLDALAKKDLVLCRQIAAAEPAALAKQTGISRERTTKIVADCRDVVQTH